MVQYCVVVSQSVQQSGRDRGWSQGKAVFSMLPLFDPNPPILGSPNLCCPMRPRCGRPCARWTTWVLPSTHPRGHGMMSCEVLLQMWGYDTSKAQGLPTVRAATGTES